MSPTVSHERDFASETVGRLRADLALALRAAAYHGLAEGVCNHFSVELPDGSDRFLLNPRGLLLERGRRRRHRDGRRHGERLAGRHEVEPTAMFIHAAVHRHRAQGLRAAHPHAVRDRADADRRRARLDTTLSQNAMRFHGRVAVDAHYNGLALDDARRRAHRARDERRRRRVPRQPRRRRLRRAHRPRVRRPVLPRARLQLQVLARSTGRPLVPVDAGAGAARRPSRRSASGCSRSCSSRRCADRSEIARAAAVARADKCTRLEGRLFLCVSFARVRGKPLSRVSASPTFCMQIRGSEIEPANAPSPTVDTGSGGSFTTTTGAGARGDIA